MFSNEFLFVAVAYQSAFCTVLTRSATSDALYETSFSSASPVWLLLVAVSLLLSQLTYLRCSSSVFRSEFKLTLLAVDGIGRRSLVELRSSLAL